MEENNSKNNELVSCKFCKEQIPKKSKVCTECEKDQRGFFMRHKITTFVLILIAIAGIKDLATLSERMNAPVPKHIDKVEDDSNTPREYKAALKQAEVYSETMALSREDIYFQLTSESGEGFPEDAAQYAIDYMAANWKENALKRAQAYAETMNMSDSAIYEQLTSQDKFTEEEAQYAIDNLE